MKLTRKASVPVCCNFIDEMRSLVTFKNPTAFPYKGRQVLGIASNLFQDVITVTLRSKILELMAKYKNPSMTSSYLTM